VFRIGPIEPVAPVILAPMAGVTNAPFRTICRDLAPGLIYVNGMVMVTALVNGNAKTERMVTFAPDESPRSLQLYGSDPHIMGEAVRRLCDADRVDHIDLNFGCPAAKVTRKGGGAAVPAKPRLLREILRAAVSAAAPYGVPVTAKFRKGLTDDLLTFLNQMINIYTTHTHPGELALGVFPVTPMTPVPPMPPATPALLSVKVKTG
jgi:tRNA-dihydrouridine synthase